MIAWLAFAFALVALCFDVALLAAFAVAARKAKPYLSLFGVGDTGGASTQAAPFDWFEIDEFRDTPAPPPPAS